MHNLGLPADVRIPNTIITDVGVLKSADVDDVIGAVMVHIDDGEFRKAISILEPVLRKVALVIDFIRDRPLKYAAGQLFVLTALQDGLQSLSNDLEDKADGQTMLNEDRAERLREKGYVS